MSPLSPFKSVLTCMLVLICFACQAPDAVEQRQSAEFGAASQSLRDEPLPEFETPEGNDTGGDEGGGAICVGDCTMPPFVIEVEPASPPPGIPVDISAGNVCTGECTMPPLVVEVEAEPPPETPVIPEPHLPCPTAIESGAYQTMVAAVATATNAREADISDLETWYKDAFDRLDDSYRDQLNGCDDTVGCFRDVTDNFRHDAAALTRLHDAQLSAIRHENDAVVEQARTAYFEACR